ncbi:M14 family metallopeptidase [Longitalea luteola]|uniref:M14 family metallopeptidase n=1 Tax=Longitalea luteola TaxID=2812563 RepID=UPI001A965203|nr:M14 family metallopeptidase [Longitalea luteola]
MRILPVFLLLGLPVFLFSQSILTKFEQSQGKETPTYHEIISWWKMMDSRSASVKMLTMGPTDAGFPLHLVVVSTDGDFDMGSLRRKNKRIILINNGIHPGEPDGIDASMLLVRDIAANKVKLPANVVLAIIPVYNIGGCLNRSPWYRVDQNGPAAFGSRGNSQNLDLNRDFIKCDSREARSFAAIFHLCDPDVFIDNHVSNGADYQHVMTLLATQHSKMGGEMGEYLHTRFEPGLYQLMKGKGYDLVPYVDFAGKTPDAGLTAYFDGPRYSSGYATLWHSFAFVPETHMLKPYEQRVKATYALMQSFIEFTAANSAAIKQLRLQAREKDRTANSFPVSWKLDTTRREQVLFKGYEAGYKNSEVSGWPRLYYDRTKPYEKQLPYYNFYTARTTIEKPNAYIVPQGWWKVIDLLKINKVQMTPLSKDTSIEVEVYRIEDYKTLPRQYEMHHLNTDVVVSKKKQAMQFRKGDYYIPLNQEANRFLVTVLEPQADDSYFAWNYFDAILGRKEGYSAYAFEDIAALYLNEHPELKKQLEIKRASDTAFARSASAQLDFVYRNSPYFEPDYLRYPVYRVP